MRFLKYANILKITIGITNNMGAKFGMEQIIKMN